MTSVVEAAERARRESGAHRTGPLFMFLWIALCVSVPVWVAPDNVANVPISVVILSYAVILYAGTRISLIISAGEPVWLPFMFWSFTYIWIGLAMYAQDLAGSNSYGVTFESGSQETACLIAITGMVSFDLGQLWSRNVPTRAPRRPRVVNQKRLIVFAVLTFVGVSTLVRNVDGLALLFSSRAERSSALDEAGNTVAFNGIIGSLMAMGLLIASACLIAVIRVRRELRRRPAWLLTTGASIFLTLVITNPIGNARYISGTVILGLLFSLGMTQRRSLFRITSSGVFLGLLLLFPYADLFRNAVHVLKWESLSYFLTSKGDYDTAAQMVAVVDYRQATGGTGGGQILGVLGFFVPRAYWPSKSGASGALITERLGVQYSNVSSPLWVEAYIDGGFVAVVVAFLALGFAMNRMSHAYALHQYDASYARIMIPLIAAYSLIVLRGSLLTAVGPLAAMVTLGWLVTSPNREWPRGLPELRQ